MPWELRVAVYLRPGPSPAIVLDGSTDQIHFPCARAVFGIIRSVFFHLRSSERVAIAVGVQ